MQFEPWYGEALGTTLLLATAGAWVAVESWMHQRRDAHEARVVKRQRLAEAARNWHQLSPAATERLRRDN